MMKKLPEADVVITNPTHYAVAIKYDADLYDAPFVIAKGADYMAQKIKDVARENNIEIVALTIPRQAAREVAKEVAEDGIKAIWNFAHTDLNMPEDVVVENVHLSESLMRLSYNIANKNGKTRNIQEG